MSDDKPLNPFTVFINEETETSPWDIGLVAHRTKPTILSVRKSIWPPAYA